MKTLIMLSAVPASGKSTWAKKYLDEHVDTYVVSSDEIRMEVCGGNYHDQSKQALVWKLFDQRIHEYALKSENATVILDALNDTNEVRLKYLNATPEFNKKILVLFPTSLEKSHKYNASRPEEVRVPENIIDMLYSKFEEPSEEVLKIVDEVIEVRW